MATHRTDAPPTPSEAWVLETRRCLLNAAPDLWQNFPWRRESLPFWQGLVAEVLLQRTRARQAEAVFRELVRRYRTAAAFGQAKREELLSLFAPLGLRWRAELLVQLAAEIGARQGRLPREAVALRAMPGVGDYAASAALSLHADRRSVIVDSNVVRVISRLVGASFDGETRRMKWLVELADRLTPGTEFRAYNYAMLDLGMRICRPVRPQCFDCPLLGVCATGTSELGRADVYR